MPEGEPKASPHTRGANFNKVGAKAPKRLKLTPRALMPNSP